MSPSRLQAALAYATAGFVCYFPMSAYVVAVGVGRFQIVHLQQLFLFTPQLLLPLFGALAGWGVGHWYLRTRGTPWGLLIGVLVPLLVAAIAIALTAVSYGLIGEFISFRYRSFDPHFHVLEGSINGLQSARLFLVLTWWIVLPSYAIASWTLVRRQENAS